MKRRPNAQAGRLQTTRRHRSRRQAHTDFTLGVEQGWVSATVFFTDPFTVGETAAWLEPDAHATRSCAASHF